jgi:CRISPR-associated protein Csb2
VTVGTTLAFRFPLGKVHANPWDRAVNEGATEWPPSPWRILRALIATWHTRWPDLPEPTFDAIFGALADPPSYQTPPTGTGHTRHYLPDLDHCKAETGNITLTLDPFLTVDKNAELLVHWDADLDADQREALAKLAELVPYLGRSESVCEVRLFQEDVMPDDTWWRPETTSGSRRTRLLAPASPLNRSVLEATTGGIRKQKRTMPAGTRWVDYSVRAEDRRGREAPRAARVQEVTAIRFAVYGRAPLLLTNGVLLADEAHRQVGNLLEKAQIPDPRRKQIMGTGGAASGHQHAHWIPLGENGDQAGPVLSLVIWVPSGLRPEEVRAVLGLRRASGKRGGDGGYEVRGFPAVDLLFQAAGTIQDVAPELPGQPARRWRSVTPYLPVRHKARNESWEDYLAEDVTTELRYRPQSNPVLKHLELSTEITARQVSNYRRYRTDERLQRHSRTGVGVVLEFEKPVTGPFMLGQLSHFGFGRFESLPDRNPSGSLRLPDGQQKQPTIRN